MSFLTLQRSAFRIVACTSLVALMGACGSNSEESSSADAERCEEIVQALTACYPDLAAEATCTPETIAMYEQYDVQTLSCDAMDDMGKADAFAFDGCDAGEHVCGFIFCCEDYTITRSPTSAEWDILDLVNDYQAATPSDVLAEQASISDAELADGVSWTWEQEIVEQHGASPKLMAVELSQRLLPIAYDDFVQKLAPQDWGVNLEYYIGGEVEVYDTDEQGRATKQVERMVLSPFPCDMDTRLGNNDMTKVELIDYGQDYARVTWRVYNSDNDSTEADVGSVEFNAYEDETLVTFYSAHRLNAPLGIHIDNVIVQKILKSYFLEHIAAYRRIVL